MHIHGGSFSDFYRNSNLLLKKYIHEVLKRSNLVICLSDSWRHFFVDELKLKNIRILGNPVSLNNDRVEIQSKRGIKLLFLGKISQQKGIFDLINYLRSDEYFLKGQINLMIGGNGDEKRLLDLLNEHSLSNYIKYFGWVDNNLKAILFKQCDIFILPSYYEGLPVSVLEAMAFSKPVIATRVGGIPEIVIEGISGWLIPPRNLDQLNHIFKSIFEDKTLLSKYGDGAFQIAQEFSTDKIMNKLDQYYSELV